MPQNGFRFRLFLALKTFEIIKLTLAFVRIVLLAILESLLNESPRFFTLFNISVEIVG